MTDICFSIDLQNNVPVSINFLFYFTIINYFQNYARKEIYNKHTSYFSDYQ